jgi:citrate lyase subunit beta/citryl-CoA lyase
MAILRSLLFVPGNRADMLQKALGFSPDVFVPDLEDSVPTAEKANARAVTASFLAKLSDTGSLIIPRVNALDTGLLEQDLAAIITPKVYGLSIGKVQTAQEIADICGLIEPLEQKAGLPIGRLNLIPWIESAKAIVNAYEICLSSERIIAVAFGAEDFTNDMDIERTDDDSEIAYARSTVCIAARAADVIALDTPYFGFRDTDGLQQDANTAKKQGFKGKFAIHPAQIDTINTTFSPSRQEVEHAKRVLATFEAAEHQGRGSTSLDGRVIDVPVVKRARAILEMADEIANQVSSKR